MKNMEALKRQIGIEKSRLEGYRDKRGKRSSKGNSYILQVRIIENIEEVIGKGKKGSYAHNLDTLEDMYNEAMDIYLEEGYVESNLPEAFRDFPERAYAMVRTLQDAYDGDATWHSKEIVIVRWIKKYAKGKVFLITNIVRDTNLNYDQVRDNVKALYDRGMLVRGLRVREGQTYITSEYFNVD